MTTDIHAIIAAAKRGHVTSMDCPHCRATKALDAVAMAEALVDIVENHEDFCETHVNVSHHSYRQAAIARECLDKIVKEAKR